LDLGLGHDAKREHYTFPADRIDEITDEEVRLEPI
jgi:hypothetical protein